MNGGPATTAWYAGFHDLVKVRAGDKVPIEKGWQKQDVTPQMVRAWDGEGCNIGLRTALYPTFDIDVDDEQLQLRIAKDIVRDLGRAVVRHGRRPALIYRTTVPFPKMKLELGGGAVEVLGDGQQVVIHGAHPSGCEYRCTPSLVDGDFHPWDLSEISQHAAADALRSLQSAFGGDLRAKDRSEPVPQSELKAESADAVADLVARIPNERSDREHYVQMGYAIKGAGGSYETFLEWCERWTGGVNDPATVKKDWDGMQPPYELGISWLHDQAKEAGVATPPPEFTADEETPHPPPDIVVVPGSVDYTDQVLARRFAAEYHDRVRYVQGIGWVGWDGRIWTEQHADVHLLDYLLEQSDLAYERIEKEGTARAVASRIASNAAAGAVRSIAQNLPLMMATSDDFDSDPYLLATPDGVVDLRTGEMAPPDAKYLCRHLTGVTPVAGYPERWWTFLDEATGGDVELALYLQVLVGYFLTGDVSEHVLHFLWGPGGNGKSVFLNLISRALGSYARTAPMEAFMASYGERHPADLAVLAGARLVVSSETQENRRWNEGLVKSLTSGDALTVRLMRQDPFTFRPHFKLCFSGNHKPKISSLDEAWRRRCRLIPFTVRPRRIDRKLPDKLMNELGQILHWAIEGAGIWLRDGLEAPQAVRAETEDYFEGSDLLGRWLQDRCVLESGAFTSNSDLYDDFAEWAKGVGERPKTQRWLADQLRAREGLTVGRTKDARGISGIRLTPRAVTEFPVQRRDLA